MAVIVKVLPELQLVMAEFSDELRREDMYRFIETVDHTAKVKADFNMLASIWVLPSRTSIWKASAPAIGTALAAGA